MKCFRYSPDFNYDSIDLNAVTYQFSHNLVPNAEKSELSLSMTTEPLLIDTFVSIVIGALRGMLVKNLKGTPLAKSVMPLIPMDVIRQNTARLTENTPQE